LSLTDLPDGPRDVPARLRTILPLPGAGRRAFLIRRDGRGPGLRGEADAAGRGGGDRAGDWTGADGSIIGSSVSLEW